MTAFLIASLALVGYALGFYAACHALLHKTDPQAALGWVAFIVLVPYVGTGAYLLFGVSRVDSYAAKFLSNAANKQLQADADIDKQVFSPRRAESYSSVEHVGQALTGNAPSQGNKFALLRNGEEAYPSMLEAIENAGSHVYLSTYIFKSGRAGEAFAAALARAAQRGADVRLIVDGVGGSLYSWRKPWKKLRRQGVKVRRFLPPKLFPPNFSINLRTHRKVLVCDGRVGFTGGMNIGDHHLVTLPGGKRAQDIHFRCEGPVAALLQEAFLTDWAFLTGKLDTPAALVPEAAGDASGRLVFDGLGRGRDNIHDLLCGVIGAAVKSVRVMTPYFLPPRELASALTSAAMRGVDVQIILPAANNLAYVHRASRHMQPDFVRRGVHIFFQPPPFAHTKLLLVDDDYALVGSANLDPRSLFLNFELNLEIFDADFCATLRAYFAEVRSRSREATIETYKRPYLPGRLLDAGCWLFSPYL